MSLLFRLLRSLAHRPPRRASQPLLEGPAFIALRRCRDGVIAYNRHDRYIGRSLAVYGEYSALEADFLRDCLRPGDVAIEAGAHIGTLTLPLARAVGAAGRVFAFEPQRLAFQILCANLALNEVTNVVARHAAVGAAAGVVPVPVLAPEREQNFGGFQIGRIPHGEPVPMERIDDLGLPACRLIKADVEGMEREVIEGARETIARSRPLLYVEVLFRDKTPALIALVQSLGYRCFWHLPPYFNPRNYAGCADDVFDSMISTNMFGLPAEAPSDLARGLAEIHRPDDWWVPAEPAAAADRA